jgi:hypothetical protein
MQPYLMKLVLVIFHYGVSTSPLTFTYEFWPLHCKLPRNLLPSLTTVSFKYNLIIFVSVFFSFFFSVFFPSSFPSLLTVSLLPSPFTSHLYPIDGLGLTSTVTVYSVISVLATTNHKHFLSFAPSILSSHIA